MPFNRVMRYFQEISQIPRGSGNTDRISKYCEEFAQEHSLFCIRDGLGNVIIKKDGTGNPVILQGHLDMVCESEAGSIFDFENSGIKVLVENGYLTADKTTLGADDGSAVAIMLDILASDDKKLPPVEAVFTVGEEIGMPGAIGLDKSLLSGKRMINIDSEAEGIITAGCAGGMIATVSLPLNRRMTEGSVYEIILSGLCGGHSGMEIGKNRQNANKLLGRVLYEMNQKISYKIASVSGGNKDNAIPRTAHAFIVTDKSNEEILKSFIFECEKTLREEAKATEDNINLKLIKTEKTKEEAFSPDALTDILCKAPNGAIEYDRENRVVTSLNLGIMYSSKEKQTLCFSLRSNLRGGTESLFEKIKKISVKYGAAVRKSGEYPCWEFKEESRLREVIDEEYFLLKGKHTVTEICHAGLECAVFADSIKGLDVVSIGPDIYDIHTPREKMSVISFETTYNLVKNVLQRLFNT